MLLEKIKNEAIINHIPIIQDQAIAYITALIKNNKITKILEIGTAIGYSSIKMALVNQKIKVTTIEKDFVRYKQAVENINQLKLEKQIKVVFGDALTEEIRGKFDLIFIDAAKSSNLIFFERFKNNLAQNGLIITDNINFSLAKKNDSKRVLRMLKKIELYRQFLIENKDFRTKFIDLGDGLSISKKRC